MSAPVDRAYERTVRVDASAEDLYEELNSVAKLARFIPQLEAPSAETGSDNYQASFSIGPVSYSLRTHVTVDQISPSQTIGLSMRAPELRLGLDGTFDLVVNAERETTVRYSAVIHSSHRVLRVLPGQLTTALEEHVDSTIGSVAVRGGQYARAKRALADPEQYT